jgi:predicted AlkP superfamily pyrophosphatase or phosphodiesterase
MLRLPLVLLLVLPLMAQPRRLLVISIDGLDNRYLRDADKLGLKTPTLRKLVREGAVAQGVVGIVPTVTWPSHTTMITGVPAALHGILTNDQPNQPAGQRWWYTKFLKARTLWQEARAKGLKVATLYWPVTVGADVNFNIPEFWKERHGHSAPLADMEAHSTATLVDRITRAYPSFPVSMLSDRMTLIATRYLLETEKPDLTLVHIADLDGEQHETGAFSRNARAVLEYQDELLAWTLQAVPPGTVVAIVSDHGFETSERVFHPKAITPDCQVAEGLVGATTDEAASKLRALVGKGTLAREVPMEEVRRLAPQLGAWKAAFETASNITLSAAASTEAVKPGRGNGVHGLWPTRRDYRASFLLWGPGIKPGKLPEISMLDEAPTFAELLGVALPASQGRSLLRLLR